MTNIRVCTDRDAKRDQNPHKAAIAAMYIYGAMYSRQGLGSMGFWDSLSPSQQDVCRRLVKTIEKARAER